jgi:sporulation protein YhbH
MAVMSSQDGSHESISKIERDHSRFRQIVRGKIKKELRKYMTQGELIGKKGKDLVSIPLPSIDIPHFRFGKNQGGVGSGEGEVGDPVGGQPQEGDGRGEAGDSPGEHILEVDLTLEELAKILGEELELPNIKPKGKRTIMAEKERYSSIRRQGPESLRHFKRTFVRALRRQIAMGMYDPDNPRIIPIKADKVYKSWQITHVPESNAVIFYMMDVSGSMGDEQKELVRTTAFWIDTWLRSQYRTIESRYITHDAAAREVDQETFYKTRESGGTAISSAYRLCSDLLDQNYSQEDWNIYCFHFSDGDNLLSDNELCFDILKKELLSKTNLFCYGQVRSLYGSGEFKRKLDDAMESENLITVDIKNKEEIYDAIKIFLGKGK